MTLTNSNVNTTCSPKRCLNFRFVKMWTKASTTQDIPNALANLDRLLFMSHIFVNSVTKHTNVNLWINQHQSICAMHSFQAILTFCMGFWICHIIICVTLFLILYRNHHRSDLDLHVKFLTHRIILKHIANNSMNESNAKKCFSRLRIFDMAQGDIFHWNIVDVKK